MRSALVAHCKPGELLLRLRYVDVELPGIERNETECTEEEGNAGAGVCRRCSMNQLRERKNVAGLALVRKPVQRVGYQQGLRDGSTGQIVFVPAAVAATATLHRVWAVAEGAAESLAPADGAEAMAGAPVLLVRPAAEVPKVQLAFYRKYTEGLLRRYLRLSMQAGRVPSLLGRELFRGHVSHYTVHGLEDVVIFCHDMEQRLAKLNTMEKELIKRIALQHYTRGETAGMLGISLNNCTQKYDLAVDRLTGLLLEAGLLDPTTAH
jgi:hypothetical protein